MVSFNRIGMFDEGGDDDDATFNLKKISSDGSVGVADGVRMGVRAMFADKLGKLDPQHDAVIHKVISALDGMETDTLKDLDTFMEEQTQRTTNFVNDMVESIVSMMLKVCGDSALSQKEVGTQVVYEFGCNKDDKPRVMAALTVLIVLCENLTADLVSRSMLSVLGQTSQMPSFSQHSRATLSRTVVQWLNVLFAERPTTTTAMGFGQFLDQAQMLHDVCPDKSTVKFNVKVEL